MHERVREIRVHFHMTQREMAEKIGVSKGFISLVETGRSGLSEENIGNLCKALHIRAAWLRDGTGAMKSENPEEWASGYESEEEKQKAAEATADRIRELRQMLHLTQKEFAEGMGSSREIVALVEQRRNRASEALLNKIEKRYRVNREWLRKGQGEMFQTYETAAQDRDHLASSEERMEHLKEHGQKTSGMTGQEGPKTECDACGEPVWDGWTYECLEYVFPNMSVYPTYHDEPEWNLRKGYLIIKNIPCRRCEECGEVYYSAETQVKLDKMIDDLFPVNGLGKGFESPGRPGASVGDVIIQSFM